MVGTRGSQSGIAWTPLSTIIIRSAGPNKNPRVHYNRLADGTHATSETNQKWASKIINTIQENRTRHPTNQTQRHWNSNLPPQKYTQNHTQKASSHRHQITASHATPPYPGNRAQESVQENQESLGMREGNKGDMDYPTESDYETELDYVDQDTTNPDEEDDEYSTLKDQDVLQLEDDNESELDDKCATKLEQMQISAEGNEKETPDQEEPTEKRQLRERKTKPGEYKDRHSGKQERTPKDTNSKRKTSTKTAKTGNNERKETPAGQQGSTAEDTNKEIKSLIEQINKIKRISKEKETENARLNRTIEEKDEEIRTLKEELKQKDKELIQVKEQLLQILLTERQNTDRDTEHMDTEETQKPTMIIAGDSNTGRMLPDIKSQLSDHSITRVTTMTSKDTKAWAEQENEETLNGNTVIIHVGTKDIRHGEKARNILANIRNAAAIVEEKGAIC